MLGDLSARYESNGDPGTVSDGYGDAGGVSYGCYQLATNTGAAAAFLQFLYSVGSTYADALSQYELGSEDFTAEWQNIAAVDSEGFAQLQHDYIQKAYYDPAVDALRATSFNIENHSEAIQQVIWSRSVQYGPGNIVEMFDAAVKSLGYDNLSYVDAVEYDADMIRAVYLNVCRSEEWTNGSPGLRSGLYSRFENECQDALNMLE